MHFLIGSAVLWCSTGVALIHESKTEDILIFVSQSVSRAYMVNMNSLPLGIKLILGKLPRPNGISFRSEQQHINHRSMYKSFKARLVFT
jgi:hypothetical protein